MVCEGGIKNVKEMCTSLFLLGLHASRRKHNINGYKRQTHTQLLLFSRWQAWKLGRKSLLLTVTWFFCDPSVKWIAS